MATDKNLQDAFAGESQANRKYLAFAKQAEADGFSQVARLFKAAAAAETIHAHAHLRVMGGIKSTAENVKAAIEGEGYEFQKMYPQFLAEAEAEKNQGAVTSFKHALAVEQIHHQLYTAALNAVQGGKDMPSSSVLVCPVCGNTVLSQAPAACPICSTPGAKFFSVK